MLTDSWAKVLPAYTVGKANELEERAKRETANGAKICPKPENIFRALKLTQPERVRCVLLGQDPYHTPGVATGLAFSIAPDCKLVPSLRNIFKELAADTGIAMPSCGDLTPWAERGVLLLNTVLTVEEGKPTSHYSWGWETVTREILRVCAALPQPTVFLLWGANARKTAEGVCPGKAENKTAFYASHPSPLGAHKGSEFAPAFIGSRPFTKANAFLTSFGEAPIDWALP